MLCTNGAIMFAYHSAVLSHVSKLSTFNVTFHCFDMFLYVGKWKFILWFTDGTPEKPPHTCERACVPDLLDEAGLVNGANQRVLHTCHSRHLFEIGWWAVYTVRLLFLNKPGQVSLIGFKQRSYRVDGQKILGHTQCSFVYISGL
jgi:hypothetical protein